MYMRKNIKNILGLYILNLLKEVEYLRKYIFNRLHDGTPVLPLGTEPYTD